MNNDVTDDVVYDVIESPSRSLASSVKTWPRSTLCRFNITTITPNTLHVTSDVNFHLKKLFLNPFSHIKGVEASVNLLVAILMKEHCLGSPKIG